MKQEQKEGSYVRSVWRNKDFAWLISGQTISEFGASITSFAIPWLMLQLTGSSLQMGLAFAIGFTPYLLLSLPAGVWADKFDRKKMMMVADCGRMILISTIPFAHLVGHVGVLQLYIIQGGLSACSALFDTAYVACLPNVVDKEQLPAANAALQSGMSASQILGPALAGTLIALFGAENTVLINGLSYFVSVVSLLVIRKKFSSTGNAPLAGNMLSQIGEGVRFVWHHKLIRTISIFTMILNLGSSATGALLLYRLHHDLHVSSSIAGLVMTGFSVGTVLGSILAGMLTRHFRMGTLMATTLLGMSIPEFLIAFSAWPYAITVANFITGLSAVVWNVQSISLRQSVIPDHLLGRCSSAIRMIVWGSMPVGSAAGGAVAQVYGAPVVFVAAGVVQTSLWFWGLATPLFKVKSIQTLQSDGAVSAS